MLATNRKINVRPMVVTMEFLGMHSYRKVCGSDFEKGQLPIFPNDAPLHTILHIKMLYTSIGFKCSAQSHR